MKRPGPVPFAIDLAYFFTKEQKRTAAGVDKISERLACAATSKIVAVRSAVSVEQKPEVKPRK